MCGRYALHSLIGDLQEHFGLFGGLDFAPHYNAAPSLPLPVVRLESGTRRLALCRWGLLPAWASDPVKARPINARAESIASNGMFRTPFQQRRCLVPANGFYEWQRAGSGKQPFYIRARDRELMGFAGIWDARESPEGTIESFAIITTQANPAMLPIHDRMPVILDPGEYGNWLEKGGTGMLAPYPGQLDAFPVSPRVNSPRNDDPALILPLSK